MHIHVVTGLFPETPKKTENRPAAPDKEETASS
jgi:hypothetical protein